MPQNIDRSEVAAVVAAVLVVLAPTLHHFNVDQWVNLDLTNVSLLVAVAVGVAAYFLHRGSKAA